MSLQIAAQHLAKKGRGPDTELVHMTKGEIAGLQSLALAHGGSLTINPHTGLAEAGFLSSILPMLAGAAANFFIPGSGAIAGGLTSALVNPRAGLGGIAMGALGGYGGGSLAGNFMNAGAQAAGAEAGFGALNTIPELAAGQLVNPAISATSAVPAVSGAAAIPSVAAVPASLNTANMQTFTNAYADAAKPSLANMGRGVTEAFNNPMDFLKNNYKGLGAIAVPIAAGMTPNYTGAPTSTQSSGNIRPFSFTRRANTDDPDNPTVDQFYTAGTPMTAPGPDNYPYQPRQTIRMAEGGTVGMMPQMIPGGSGTGSSDMPTYKFNRTISGTAAEPTVDQYFTLVPPQGTSEVETPEFMRAFSGDAGMGGGLDSGFNSGFDSGFKSNSITGGLLASIIGSQDPTNVPVVDMSSVSPAAQAETKAAQAEANAAADAAGGPGIGAAGGDGTFGGGEYARGGFIQRMAAGGISSLGSYSDGGQLLRGPGDGVSDNIPAVIGKRQPARLANNEFVIPARIVSELGNGSTDAGAKELYKMMARVQKARSKTVGKNQIAVDSKARNLLPA